MLLQVRFWSQCLIFTKWTECCAVKEGIFELVLSVYSTSLTGQAIRLSESNSVHETGHFSYSEP